jgi:hypothetical protein
MLLCLKQIWIPVAARSGPDFYFMLQRTPQLLEELEDLAIEEAQKLSQTLEEELE